MSMQNAVKFFQPGTLVITPGDREDIIQAASLACSGPNGSDLCGIVLTGNLRPSDATLKIISELPFPVLLAADDSYEVASQVHDIIVKTRPDDAEKIAVIRDLIAQHVDVAKLVGAL
mgnify:CR=1 FL=1